MKNNFNTYLISKFYFQLKFELKLQSEKLNWLP